MNRRPVQLLLSSQIFEIMELPYTPLLITVQIDRDAVRDLWERAISHPDQCFGSGIQNYSIESKVNGSNLCSVIPSYNIYGLGWFTSTIINPLEKDWLTFDPTRKEDIKYLADVIEIMDEQIDFWSVDKISKDNEVYKQFEIYLDSLKKFYKYVADKYVLFVKEQQLTDEIIELAESIVC